MRCPFGYEGHSASWRCFAAYAIDWVCGRWELPEPVFIRMMQLLVWVERPQYDA